MTVYRCLHRHFIQVAYKLIEGRFNDFQWCGTAWTRSKEPKRDLKKSQTRHKGNAELFSVLQTLQFLLIMAALWSLRSDSLRNHRAWSTTGFIVSYRTTHIYIHWDTNMVQQIYFPELLPLISRNYDILYIRRRKNPAKWIHKNSYNFLTIIVPSDSQFSKFGFFNHQYTTFVYEFQILSGIFA